MSDRPARTLDKFIVRLPDGMRDQISKAARAAGRSMTAEVVARLQASFDCAGPANLNGELEPRVLYIEGELGSFRKEIAKLKVEIAGLKSSR